MAKILIIDDDIFIREILTDVLISNGYETFIAKNGIDGLKIFEEHKPEIVLIDIKLPGINGIEVLEKIKKKSPKSEAIIITGQGDVNSAIQAIKNGAFGYVQKSADYYELLIEIKKALDKQNLQNELDKHVYNLEKAIKEKTKELKLRKKAEDSLQKNIDQAKESQAKLIHLVLPKIYDIRFYNKCIPCEKVGGDICNIIIKDDEIIFYLSDISGHGVPAAILSSFVKANIDNSIIIDNITSPKKIILLLKKVLKSQEIFKENLLTIFVGKLNLNNKKLTYINAGNFPLIINTEKDNKKEFIEIEKTFKPISELLEFEDYKEETIKLNNNTKVLLYSDGLIEWLDDNNNITGRKILIEYLKKYDLSNESIEIFIAKKMKKIQKDDVSYIFFEINNFFKKTFYGSYKFDKIINEFEEELENRYSNKYFNYRAMQCFYEIFSNAVEHGNKNRVDKKVEIEVIFKRKFINFHVKDEGDGFDWKNITKKIPGNESCLRGRGLFLVQKFSNKIKFNEKGNEVLVIVKIN